jgi:cytochrome c553
MCAIACALFALAGCERASADVPTRQAKQFEHDMMVRLHMHENFGLLRAIEKLLVRGKLGDAQAFARAISEAPDEPGFQPFAKRAAEVRERAAALAAAPTVDEGCRREAQLAAACAGCHVDSGVLPEFNSLPRLPSDDASIPARMARHLWATDRLWEGVVGQSDDAWRAGLDVLAATPPPWAKADRQREQLAGQLQRLAKQARQMQPSDQPRNRARDYGEILGTCAACHAIR